MATVGAGCGDESEASSFARADGAAEGAVLRDGGDGSASGSGPDASTAVDATTDRVEHTVDDPSSGVPDATFPDVTFAYDAPVRDVDLSRDSACAFTSASATHVPLDLVVMLDRSGSMINPGFDWDPDDEDARRIEVANADCDAFASPLKDSKWCYAVNALATYFTSPSAAGNRVALQYFPFTAPPEPVDAVDPDGGDFNCASSENNVLATPAAPVGTPWATLPGNASGDANLLVASLNANRANWEPWGTPTTAAVHGIEGIALARHAASRASGRTLVAVLITDGDPNQCPPSDGLGGTDPQSIADLRASIYAATGGSQGGVRTFVVGMTGANFARLDMLAAGAGIAPHTVHCDPTTTPCSYYSVGDGDGQRLVEVLEEIQGQSLKCSYAVPSAAVRPSEIKVTFSPGASAPKDFPRVAGPSACTDADGGARAGFYFDGFSDAGVPLALRLCPASCDEVESDATGLARMDILYGCPVN
ncbi:MAG: hypothetical protein U0169_23490 [Polyangiaceae bacterium]